MPAPASAAGASPAVDPGVLPLGTGTRPEVPWTTGTSAAPWRVSKVPLQMKAPAMALRKWASKPDSKAPATRSSRGGESFLSSPARSLTGLSSLPRQGFEGLQGPPTCAAGAGSGVSSGTGREERVESSMGEKCSSFQEMPKWGNWRGFCKPSSARMVTKSRGHPGAGDIRGLEHCGTCPMGPLVALNFCKVSSPGNLKGFVALQDGGRDADPCFTRLLEGPGPWRVCFLPKSELWGEQRWFVLVTEMEFGSYCQQSYQ